MAGEIAALDDALRRAGETIIIRRYTAPTGSPRPKSDVSVLAAVRAINATEIVGDIDQTGSVAIVSPTGLDALLPLVKGDMAIIQGREREIELPKPFYVQDVLCRIELLVKG